MEQHPAGETRRAQLTAPFTFESAYRSAPALPEPLSDAERSRIAKLERAERFARSTA